MARMENRWNESEAAACGDDVLALRVYTSRLLGQDPALVLHGGGNTSIKVEEEDFYGAEVAVLYVKGSGWDLATIEKAGFAPVRMDALLRLAEFDALSDADMVRQQRAAMTDPDAPNASVEAILHALIPFRVVDHTHADAVVALTNNPDGEARVRAVYGHRVLVVPYVMPGFILARTVFEMTRDVDWSSLDGIVLMNHGIFTFGDDPKSSYERMIGLVAEAEEFLGRQNPGFALATSEPEPEDLLALARIRRRVSDLRGCPVIARLDRSPGAAGYAGLDGIADIATRGPLTPDHSIRTKRVPAVLGDDPLADIDAFAKSYRAYFDAHHGPGQTLLPPDPRWAVWPGQGIVAFGATESEAAIVADIAEHTHQTVQLAEAAGGWEALPPKEIFDVEYWSLEQAKLQKSASSPPFRGKVAVVTGAAAGIGFACAASLAEQGAKVVGLDLNPEIVEAMATVGGLGMVVDLTDDEKVRGAVAEVVRRFGGLDVVVSNAGIFTAGQFLEELEQSNWDKSMAVNLTSHQKLLKYTIPFLKEGIDPAVVLVGSRNVSAPGAGAASYSCAKAGLTQLCRVAAMELAPCGVRCNIVHPDAVFDTKLWTPEALRRSAERYGLTEEEYKTRNLMKTEIKSKDVGNMVAAMASPLFGKTTGAQIPVDGGNDRVI
ncbi:bifunctional aldolase/short-chain dehydrogenase [soil metagenome]